MQRLLNHFQVILISFGRALLEALVVFFDAASLGSLIPLNARGQGAFQSKVVHALTPVVTGGFETVFLPACFHEKSRLRAVAEFGLGQMHRRRGPRHFVASGREAGAEVGVGHGPPSVLRKGVWAFCK